MAKNVAESNSSPAQGTDPALEAIAILTRTTKSSPASAYRSFRISRYPLLSRQRSSLRNPESKKLKFAKRVLINEGPVVIEFDQQQAAELASEEDSSSTSSSDSSDFDIDETLNLSHEELKLHFVTEKNTLLNKTLARSHSEDETNANLTANITVTENTTKSAVVSTNDENGNAAHSCHYDTTVNNAVVAMERNGKTDFLRSNSADVKPVPSWRQSLNSKPNVSAKPTTASKPWIRPSKSTDEPKPIPSETTTIRLVSKRSEAVALKSQNDHTVDNEEFYEKYGVIKVTRDGVVQDENVNTVQIVDQEPKPDVPRSYRLVSKAPIKLVMPDSLDDGWTTMTLRSETLGGEEKIIPAITDEEAKNLKTPEEEIESSSASEEEKVENEESKKEEVPTLDSSLDTGLDDGVNNNKSNDMMSTSLTEVERVLPIEFSMLSAEAPEMGNRSEKKKKKGGIFKRLWRSRDREEKSEPKEGTLVSTWSDPGLLDEEDPGQKRPQRSDMNGRPLPSVDGSWMDDVLKVLNIGNEEGMDDGTGKKVDFVISEESETEDEDLTTSSSVTSSPALGKRFLKKPRRKSDVANSPNKILDAFRGPFSRRSVDETGREERDERVQSGRGLTALDLVDMHLRKQNESEDRKFQTLPTRAGLKMRPKLDMVPSEPPTSPTSGKSKPVLHPPKPTQPPPPIPEDLPMRNEPGPSPSRESIQSPRKPPRPMSSMETTRNAHDPPPPVPVTSRPSQRPERPPPPRLFRASTSDMPHPPVPNGRQGEPFYEMYGSRSGNFMKNTYDYIDSEQPPDPKAAKKTSRFSRANIKKSFSLSDKPRKLPFLPKSKKQRIYEAVPGQDKVNKTSSPDQYEDLDAELDDEDEHEENIYDPIESPPVPDFDPSLSSPVDDVRPEDYLIPHTQEQTPPPRKKRQAPKALNKNLTQVRQQDEDSLCSVSSAEEYNEINDQNSTKSGESLDPLIALNQATLAVLGTISQMNLDTLKKTILDYERQQKHILVGAGQRFLEYELKSEVPLVQNAVTRFYKAIVKKNRQQCVVLLTHDYLSDVLVSPKCPNGLRLCMAFEDFVSSRLLPPNPKDKEVTRSQAGQSRPAPAITRGKISILKYNDLMPLDKFLDIVSANKEENYFCNVAFILIQILFLGSHLLQNGKLFRDLSLSGIIVVPSSEGTHIQVLIDPSYIDDESASESGLQTLCNQLLSLIKITLVDEKASDPSKMDTISLDVYRRVKTLLCAVLKSNHPNNLYKCVDVLGFILWGPFGDALDMINSSNLEMECQNWLDTEYAKDVNRLARGETIDSTWTYFKLKYLCQMEGGATVANVIRSLKDCLEPP